MEGNWINGSRLHSLWFQDLNIDKIPIHLLTHAPGDEEYTLGSLKLTKAEYANAEKINEIIDYLEKMDLR